MRPPAPGLARAALAEAVGAGALVAIVVGSGIMAASLSPHDLGLQLLENSAATALGLGVLILVFAPVSGAHFNPAVTLAAWTLGRGGDRITGRVAAAYVAAQLLGGVAGAVTANLMFALPAVTASTHVRSAPHLWLGEVVATCGLVGLVLTLTRQRRARLAPAAVGAYIGAAYWFTSSTSFANPAVTVARAFTNTFAGIAPASVAAFVAAQLVGAALGAGLALLLHPTAADPPPIAEAAAVGPAIPAASAD